MMSTDTPFCFTITKGIAPCTKDWCSGCAKRASRPGWKQRKVDVVDLAEPPSQTISIKPWLLMIAGLFVGLICGVVTILLLESMEDRVLNSEQAERISGLTVLAYLGHANEVHSRSDSAGQG